MEDDFEIVEAKLPYRPGSTTFSLATTAVEKSNLTGVEVELHPVPERNALLVSVVPPRAPELDIPHVPCDIVLVIDVSYSMITEASLPMDADPTKRESTGLTVLDLTKHAARTIIETMNDADRLAIVTFSTDSKVVYKLAHMTKPNKTAALRAVEVLRPISSTNLWHGLKDGLKVLAEASPNPENVQALFVLTDGMPNHMCPQQGYVPKLRPMLREQQSKTKKLPLINTFGFGYDIRSGLLQSIAEVSNGNFAFIPDAGMLGTVFIHAIANLYTTFATSATIAIQFPESVKLSLPGGFSMGIELDEPQPSSWEFTVNLGNLHYGQSRDIVLHYEQTSRKTPEIEAVVSYNRGLEVAQTKPKKVNLSQSSPLPKKIYDYHRSRTTMCALLRSAFHQKPDLEYTALNTTEALGGPQAALEALIAELKKLGHTDEENMSLLQDVAGEDPHGQVRLAISDPAFYKRWGRHYLLSVLNAHTHQICNSFKDPGPLQYGKDSPFFCRCRQELDDYFENLPPPKPSGRVPTHAGAPKLTSMRMYNMSSAPCFAGHCKVKLDGKGNSIPVRDVRAGMSVWTPSGPRSVKAVVATTVRDSTICKLGSLYITPWHPIKEASSGNWAFPCEIPHESVAFSGTVYSVLLERSGFSSPDAHAISIGGHVCVTLGHGMTSGEQDDVRVHEFLGDYTRVARSLSKLPRDARGVLRSRGLRRDPETGLACSFIGAAIRVRARSGKYEIGAGTARTKPRVVHGGRAARNYIL